MIIGLGTDICENNRIDYMRNKYRSRFLDRIYTQEELGYCLSRKNPIPHLTARFALKEAFIKSLYLRKTSGLSYKEVFLWGPIGRKDITVSGKLKKLFQDREITRTWFSIAHTENYAIATVLLEK